MRLIKNIIEESLKEYQEGTLNKEFNPYKYYAIIQLCIAYLEETINYKEGITGQRTKHINNLYYNYLASKYNQNKKQEEKYRQELETQMIIDTKHIHTFFTVIQNIDTEEDIRTELYNQKRIGFLSYELP